MLRNTAPPTADGFQTRPRTAAETSCHKLEAKKFDIQHMDATIAQLSEVVKALVGTSASVTPDGARIVCAQWQAFNRDLCMVDNFDPNVQ